MSLSSPLIRTTEPKWETYGDVIRFFDIAELDRESGKIVGENEIYSYSYVINMVFFSRPQLGAPHETRKCYITLAQQVKRMAEDKPAPKESLGQRILNVFSCCRCETDLAYKERRIIADASLKPENFGGSSCDDYDPSC